MINGEVFRGNFSANNINSPLIYLNFSAANTTSAIHHGMEPSIHLNFSKPSFLKCISRLPTKRLIVFQNRLFPMAFLSELSHPFVRRAGTERRGCQDMVGNSHISFI
jgi:hypothetical protein